MTTKEVLEKAKAIIADPFHWTKGAFARNSHGTTVIDVTSEDACSFCALGALVRVMENETDYNHARDILELCVGDKNFPNVPAFNDASETTHADILALFDCAIEEASHEQL